MDAALFRRGIPLAPDVEKLWKAFDVKIGDLIKHDDISRVIEEAYGSNRYRAVVQSWRQRVERERLLRIKAEKSVGYRALPPAPALAASVADLGHLNRAHRKAAIYVEFIDTKAFNDTEKKTYDLTRRNIHEMHDLARRACKEIAAPSPIKPTRPLAE